MSITSNVRRVTATAARATTGRWRRLAALGAAGAFAATSFAVIGSASAATSGRSSYCDPTPNLCGSADAHTYGVGANQFTGQTSITDSNPYCGISYLPDEQGWVRVWWEDNYSNYYGQVNGVCIVHKQANFTTPVRSGHYALKFQFLACPHRVVKGNYSACRLGKIVTLQ